MCISSPTLVIASCQSGCEETPWHQNFRKHKRMMIWNMVKHCAIWSSNTGTHQCCAQDLASQRNRKHGAKRNTRMSLLATLGRCSKRPAHVRCVKKLIVLPAHHALGRCHHTTTDSCNKGTTLSIRAWSFAGSEMWAICSRQNAALLVRRLENGCTLSIHEATSTTNAVNCKNDCFCGHFHAAQMRVDECTQSDRVTDTAFCQRTARKTVDSEKNSVLGNEPLAQCFRRDAHPHR